MSEHKPDIALHIGLDEGRTTFNLERSASRDGYHQNLDLDHKVFGKAEIKKQWGKGAETLQTSLDLDDVLRKYKSSKVLKELGRGAPEVTVSDKVGDFVCGFIYYLSLDAMEKEQGRRDVVFLHVPMLKAGREVEIGVRIVEELCKALASSWLDGREG